MELKAFATEAHARVRTRASQKRLPESAGKVTLRAIMLRGIGSKVRALTVSALLTLAAITMPAIAKAAPTPIYECQFCSSAGMANTAIGIARKKYPSPRPGQGLYVNVYNLGDNLIKTYWVGWYQSAPPENGDPARYKWYATLDVTSSSVKSAFASIRKLYVDNGMSLIFLYPTSVSSASSASSASYNVIAEQMMAATQASGCNYPEANGTVNVYDIATSSGTLNRVRDEVKARHERAWGPSIWNALNVVQLVAGVLSGGSYEVPYVISTPLADGGNVSFRYDYTIQQLKLVPGGLEDCEGNTVPTDEAAISGGKSSFNNAQNFNYYNNYITNVGVPINYDGSGAGTWICTGGESGGRVVVTCRLQKK